MGAKDVLEDIRARQEAKRMNLDIADQVVAMANDMVKGTSKLTLTEAKLLRLLIMQVKPTDKEFELFELSVSDFSELLQVDSSNVYREMERITDHLMREVIYIGDGNPKHKWERFPWLSYCKYDNGILTIELSRYLKPYLIGLRKWYTQYRLEDIVGFVSIYSIRMYELISMAMKDNLPYGDNVTQIYLDMDAIKRATGTEDKYERISQFKQRVLDAAMVDINSRSVYHVEYRDYKEHRRVIGFFFYVQSQARHRMMGDVLPKKERKKKENEQITLKDVGVYPAE